jgi:phospholipid/cholesterol/gamma-HCH transport system permease protein
MSAPQASLGALGRFALFLWDCGVATLRHGLPWSEVLGESYRIGVRALPILLVITFFLGTTLAVQGYNAFQPLGGSRLVGMFVALAGVREMAPIIAASMVAAKAGTEMASQIGVMRIREQIDALEVMAVHPLAWLVAPRLLGILFVLPALTTISIFVVLAAAFLTSVYQLNVSPEIFIEFVRQGLKPEDLLWGQLKAMAFGIIICTVSCYQGYTCTGGPEGVGAATNRAVVISAVLCVALNYLLSRLMFT